MQRHLAKFYNGYEEYQILEIQLCITRHKDLHSLRNSLRIQKIFISDLSDCFRGLKTLHQYIFAFTEMESSHARTLHMEME